ncbi:MAG: hypothetical protein HZA78_09055 [Candidatus Schekmanbacteria bacterium]|nr:hypothetical protein [Candidatus Schekmanbacteria bacterium]
MPTITISSDKPVVIIPVEEYENMMETIELLAENPNLLQELKEERADIDKGNFITFTDFKKKYKVE